MTKLFNDPARFTEDMLVGFLDANASYVPVCPAAWYALARPGRARLP